jgi:hypothetical protein
MAEPGPEVAPVIADDNAGLINTELFRLCESIKRFTPSLLNRVASLLDSSPEAAKVRGRITVTGVGAGILSLLPLQALFLNNGRIMVNYFRAENVWNDPKYIALFKAFLGYAPGAAATVDGTQPTLLHMVAMLCSVPVIQAVYEANPAAISQRYLNETPLPLSIRFFCFTFTSFQNSCFFCFFSCPSLNVIFLGKSKATAPVCYVIEVAILHFIEAPLIHRNYLCPFTN